jgi:hypothetical protein
MPGIGDEIDGAMQQAPQPLRQFIRCVAPSGAEWRQTIGNPVGFAPDFCKRLS